VCGKSGGFCSLALAWRRVVKRPPGLRVPPVEPERDHEPQIRKLLPRLDLRHCYNGRSTSTHGSHQSMSGELSLLTTRNMTLLQSWNASELHEAKNERGISSAQLPRAPLLGHESFDRLPIFANLLLSLSKASNPLIKNREMNRLTRTAQKRHCHICQNICHPPFATPVKTLPHAVVKTASAFERKLDRS
jgi:hypothetical protein